VVEFRTVSTADDEVRALLATYFHERQTGFPSGVYRVAHPEPSSFMPPCGVFLLVDHEGQSIGCGGVRRIADGAEGPRFEIKHLYLRAGARGTGHGRALLAELESRAAGMGARELVLDTNASLLAAGALYRSSGYRETEPYNDNPNATHWYAKRVDA
jgi:GNAT superfamily N-acetyltransferase